jgi:NADH:ubiquinone oxidoreductase subunit
LKKTRDIDNVCKLTIKKVINLYYQTSNQFDIDMTQRLIIKKGKKKVNVNKAKYVGLLHKAKS